MKSAFMGIDPGIHGAIALITDNRVWMYDLPVKTVRVGQTNRTEYDMYALTQMVIKIKDYWQAQSVQPCVVLEQVGTMPHDGRVGAFSFGRSFGRLEGMLWAQGLEPVLVHPLKWKRRYGLLGSDKNASIAKAKQLYPCAVEYFTLKKHHDRADALLLADYGKIASAL